MATLLTTSHAGSAQRWMTHPSPLPTPTSRSRDGRKPSLVTTTGAAAPLTEARSASVGTTSSRESGPHMVSILHDYRTLGRLP